jgi:hypothetical protein
MSFKFEKLSEHRTEFEKNLFYKTGAQIGLVDDKCQRGKISCYCPFKKKSTQPHFITLSAHFLWPHLLPSSQHPYPLPHSSQCSHGHVHVATAISTLTPLTHVALPIPIAEHVSTSARRLAHSTPLPA